jgi:hypothetical protein
MARSMLAMLMTVVSTAAQELAWNALLHQRMAEGKDLIELRWRRDEHGLLEVASSEGGARPFEPAFPPHVLRVGPYARTGLPLMLLFTQGEGGLLGVTDSERHLRRAGFEVAPVPLRQFLVAPFPAGDPVRARIDLLDRMVAIDWLQRHGHRGAVAELIALTARADTPAPLAARAKMALAALEGRPAATARRRLQPEDLRLPAAADAFVMVDHARLPDLLPLRELTRRLAVDRSYIVVEMLRAPTPDDLYYGQYLPDVVGELPFEVARRFGNGRCDHTVMAFVGQAGGVPLTFAWSVHTAGEFEQGVLAAGLEPLATLGVQCERRGDTVHVVTPVGEGECSAVLVRAHSKDMAGRARPELARQLLAEGPAVRIVVPKNSKAWLALPALELPPAERAEFTMSFGDGCRFCLTITARDEDAATAWAAAGNQLLASAVADSGTWASANFRPRPWLPEALNGMKPLADLIREVVAATKIVTDGNKVQAVMTSKTMGAPALAAFRSLVQ